MKQKTFNQHELTWGLTLERYFSMVIILILLILLNINKHFPGLFQKLRELPGFSRTITEFQDFPGLF